MRTPDTAGAWTAEVRRPRGTFTRSLRFTSDGRAFLDHAGVGTWQRTGDGFTFRITEPIVVDGRCTGWVAIEQHAVWDGDSFAAHGVSVVHDATGNPSYRVPVAITARHEIRTAMFP
ncbi:hypothetical protein [Lentzea nigeriaca]|uniref:hypothetical protein n=1 Tax=Lentzea nigeriaca TaxID=1128665 RepID=UPI00195C3000|nr:hypothetical protein [Lentzea nigeriaca]MBM7862192.1 hypothetical protein [Lentzea nigeriaca]